MSVLSEPQYHSEEDAYAFVEAHVWASGRVCPHCGVFDKSGLLKGKSTRIGALQVLCLPEAVYCQDRDHLRGQPRQASYLAASDLPALLV